MPSDAALAALNDRLEQITAALRLMVATQQTHTEMLAKLIEAATPSVESPLEAAMAEIAGALRDQTATLQRVERELSGLGGEIESGVMRGLAGALGVVDVGGDDGGTEDRPGPDSNRSPAEPGSGRHPEC